uniref:RNA binding protein n=1 Tax=Rhizophora mucronata TaxID=61149 RepID=A0A2P2LUM5_RHIMU
MINGCRIVVEEKRSTSRGNNRGRFSSGGGAGYRSEGARGRANFGGGKTHSRGDFSTRTEFGNRGSGRNGFPNHGGNGYWRDKAGNNGGRTNRTNELTLNAAAKNMALRVSATA